ncbi:MAG: hypothetical protein J7L96_06460, partial [Bacteroidales bacterium]|nr:hypothetical protein [Bacteroidales bacterium]
MIDNSGILLEKASHEQNANWLLLWMMALVLLFLFIRLFYSSYWKRYRLAMLFPVEAEKLLKEKNINILQVAMSLNLAASLSISLFLFLLINY